MDAIDRRLLDALLPALAAQPNKPRFIYTGGCWLFGATGDAIATEATPFRPLPAFAWMVPNLQRVLEATEVDGIVIHPAMVYAGAGGVFRRFAADAVERDAVRVVAGERVRWPLVHAEDLASLYALALESAPARSSYIGAAIDGLRSAASRGLLPGASARGWPNRRSFQPTRSRPNSANGPAATRSTSGSAAPRRGANSAGSLGISIRKPKSRRCRERTASHPHQYGGSS